MFQVLSEYRIFSLKVYDALNNVHLLKTMLQKWEWYSIKLSAAGSLKK